MILMLFPENDIFMINYPYVENYSPVNKPPTLYAILNSLVNLMRKKKQRLWILQQMAEI